MIYAQIMAGGRLHIAAEPGEEVDGYVVRRGHLSAPLCHTPRFDGSYRMTINVPLANACKTCRRIASKVK